MARLAPAWTFDALHPPRTSFVPLSEFPDLRFVAENAWQQETISGSIISCLGSMPGICHSRALSDCAAEFLELCGLALPADMKKYDSTAEGVELARELSRGTRIVSVYPPPAELRSHDIHLVPPALYNWLNSKANLAALCPADVLPARLVIGNGEPLPAELPFPFPIFVKGAVEGANGAGLDVRFCNSAEEAEAAFKHFRPESGFTATIIERVVPFVDTWCLNYAILDDRIVWLGGARQIFSAPGKQSGSSIDPRNPPPDAAVEIGLGICERAKARGYRGFCGLDMCVDGEGAIHFFDLNFRMAASTTFILLLAGLETDRVGMTCNFLTSMPLADALKQIADLGRSNVFIPTRLYDGTGFPGNAPNLITGFVAERDFDAASARIAEMRALVHA